MIAEKLIDDLNGLIAQIDEARSKRNTRKATVLEQGPTIDGAREIEAINKSLASLRLAEDILNDAIADIGLIAEKDPSDRRQA